MNTSVAIPRPPYAIGPLSVLIVLIAVYVFGALSGYLIRPSNVAAPAPTAAQQAAAVCPAGTHVVVWYTARTWACVGDATS